ncbi:MAG: L,D-transpeptidase family protein, partial [Gammaproteobacteria bacterium]|nr:L,D-transpeptidase family protein [Gammaproteobacteria bacterium]
AERFQPVWSGPQGPNRRAEQFREQLRRAGAEGLVPSNYHTELIEGLWDSGEETHRLQLELLLSSAFFDYARDVRSGQLEPQQVAPLWKIEKASADAVTLLRLALLLDDFHGALDALPPAHPGYRRLRQALARYRAIERKGEWPTIPDGALLRPGMKGARVALLRRRLALEGDLQLPLGDEAGSGYFDQALSYAVRRFQVRHGLQVDGVVGEKTLQALNVMVAERIEQIVLTMERWRWLPQYLGRRHLIVNIPALELTAFEDGEAKLAMPVIIGTTERSTPVISGLLHTVVFNPDWTVPRNLALRDVVPRQRSNPDYMTSQNIRVFADWNGDEELEPQQVDWSKVNINYFPYMLRQDPGPENALGKVKFLFYNHHDIYLHDTPHTGLFSSHERAYSSGCIRLEEPKRLASFVLAEEEGWYWDEVMVQFLFDQGETFEVALSARIPVYVLYFTAWAGEHGAVHFRPDIYGEDAMLRPCMPFEEQTP